LTSASTSAVGLALTAIEADVRPALVAVPAGDFTASRRPDYKVRVPGTATDRPSGDRATIYAQNVDDLVFVSVPLRNAGVGIAFVLPAPTLIFQGRHTNVGGEITARHVPPGEFTRALFAIPAGGDRPSLDALTTRDGFSVEVEYVDLAGAVWLTRLDWKPLAAPEQWALAGTAIRGIGRLSQFEV
jgi:hypothetical protein